MTDLKIPNLNKKSDKLFFKKKLTLRRKSRRKLLTESFLMFSLGILIIYLNVLIPSKNTIFKNTTSNLKNLFVGFRELLYYFYQVSIVVLIVVSLIFAVILIVGGSSRIIKVVKRKSKKLNFK